MRLIAESPGEIDNVIQFFDAHISYCVDESLSRFLGLSRHLRPQCVLYLFTASGASQTEVSCPCESRDGRICASLPAAQAGGSQLASETSRTLLGFPLGQHARPRPKPSSKRAAKRVSHVANATRSADALATDGCGPAVQQQAFGDIAGPGCDARRNTAQSGAQVQALKLIKIER